MQQSSIEACHCTNGTPFPSLLYVLVCRVEITKRRQEIATFEGLLFREYSDDATKFHRGVSLHEWNSVSIIVICFSVQGGNHQAKTGDRHFRRAPFSRVFRRCNKVPSRRVIARMELRFHHCYMF